MTKIKLCGMRRLEDVTIANELKPDYVGFIFVPGRKRNVDLHTASEMRKALDPQIKTVGVFLDAEPHLIYTIARHSIIDVVQLHGHEDEAFIEKLRRLISKPIIKAFRIESEEDLDAAARCSADLILLDAGNGGTGTSFDWNLLADFKRPFILAGGLGPDNITAALKQVAPYGVDVSSGTETDGYKDPVKMRSFVEQVRAYDNVQIEDKN